MNKSYKSVWNESTGSWVAVSELANGRSKSKRAKTAISKAILAQMAVGGLSIAGMSAAMASSDQVVFGDGAAANVVNGVAIGTGATVDAETDTIHFPGVQDGGLAIGNNALAQGSGVAIGENTQASSESLAFGYGSTAIAGSTAIGRNARSFNKFAVALGENASAGGIGSIALGASAQTTSENSVALGQGSVADRSGTVSVGSAGAERQITNVQAGSQDTDAINLKQLKQAGITVDTSGNLSNSFVAYDGSTQDQVTLKGTAGTKISNVMAGTSATDAVNFQQLTDAGIKIGTDGKPTNSFVAYDSTAKDMVSLLGANGTTITNVKAGALNANSKDAVNGSQLFNTASSLATVLGGGAAAGQDGTISAPTYNIAGKPYKTLADALDAAAATGGSGGGSADAVMYDSGAHNSVTLGTGSAGAQVHGVVAGTALTDAVNVSQLNQITPSLYIMAGPTDKTNSIQADGTDSIAIGLAAKSTGTNAVAVGSIVNAAAANAVAVGYNTTASATNATAVGSTASVRSASGFAAGDHAAVMNSSPNGIAIGTGATSSADSAVALGNGAIAWAQNAYAIGTKATVTGAGTFSLVIMSMQQVQTALCSEQAATVPRITSCR